MMVHVVIPVFNCKKYLRQTVESVLNQPSKDIDVVLIDDGSSDGSRELCDKIAEVERRVAVVHQENKGVSAARNAGIEFILNDASCEDYIAFLDADDWWRPGVITEDLAEYIRQKNQDIYGFGIIVSDWEGNRFSKPSCYVAQVLQGGNDAIWKLQNSFGAHFYRVALLQQYGIRFLESAKYSEDKYFRFQCAFLANGVELMTPLLYIYRDNPVGAMAKSMTIPPIDYYLPIIEGWLQSDTFINGWAEESGRRTQAGSSLANVYIIDMTAEQCKRQRSLREIMRTIRENPHYRAFCDMKPMGKKDRYYKEKVLLLDKPLLYAMKYRLIGLIECPLRFIKRTKTGMLLKKIWKYPLCEIPES